MVLPCRSQLRFTHLSEQGTQHERPRVNSSSSVSCLMSHTSMASGMCPKPCSSFDFSAMLQQCILSQFGSQASVSSEVCGCGNQVPPLIPHVILRLRLQWPALGRLEVLLTSSFSLGAQLSLFLERRSVVCVHTSMVLGMCPKPCFQP